MQIKCRVTGSWDAIGHNSKVQMEITSRKMKSPSQLLICIAQIMLYWLWILRQDFIWCYWSIQICKLVKSEGKILQSFIIFLEIFAEIYYSVHWYTRPVSFGGGGGAEVSCPNISSSTCLKIKWLALPECDHLKTSRGGGGGGGSPPLFYAYDSVLPTNHSPPLLIRLWLGLYKS